MVTSKGRTKGAAEENDPLTLDNLAYTGSRETLKAIAGNEHATPKTLYYLISRTADLGSGTEKPILLAIARNKSSDGRTLEGILNTKSVRPYDQSIDVQEILEAVAAHKNATAQIENRVLLMLPPQQRQVTFRTEMSMAQGKNTGPATLAGILKRIDEDMPFSADPSLMDAVVKNENATTQTLLRAALKAGKILEGHNIKPLFDNMWVSITKSDAVTPALLKSIPEWVTTDMARAAIKKRLAEFEK